MAQSPSPCGLALLVCLLLAGLGIVELADICQQLLAATLLLLWLLLLLALLRPAPVSRKQDSGRAGPEKSGLYKHISRIMLYAHTEL